MNKKINLFFVLLFVCASSFAQIYTPVKWHFEKKITGENSADLIIRAAIDKGWYLYGTELPEGGPRPTSIIFDRLNNAALEGEIQLRSNLKFEYDVNFGMELNWYSGEAVFVQSISFADVEKIYIEGHIEYMVCNASTCLPPTQEFFEFGLAANRTANTTTDTTQTMFFTPFEMNFTQENGLSRFWTPVIDELQALGEMSSANI